jgi:hypothetical protein
MTTFLLTITHVIQACILGFAIHTLTSTSTDYTSTMYLYAGSYAFFMIMIVLVLYYFDCSDKYQNYWSTFYLSEVNGLLSNTTYHQSVVDQELTELHRRRTVAKHRSELLDSIQQSCLMMQALPYTLHLGFFFMVNHFALLSERANMAISGVGMLLYAIQHWTYISTLSVRA